jgi:hypothetical protein
LSLHPSSSILTSPDLTTPAVRPASPLTLRQGELKFVVPGPALPSLIQWLGYRLDPDPHGDPARGEGYAVSTLYFDTPNYDIFRKSAVYRRSKYRVRRYNSEPVVYLEKKSKWNAAVVKRRTPVRLEEFVRLGRLEADPDWTGAWFDRRLRKRRLHPVCWVHYERLARVGRVRGAAEESMLRVTLDREIVCRPAVGLALEPALPGHPLLPGQGILEVKAQGMLPGSLVELLDSLELAPAHVSKYGLSARACMEGAGAAAPDEAHWERRR